MTEIPQKGCALVTGAGGRLGRLLRAAALAQDTTQRRFLFQSRDQGADICWSPGMSPSALPRCESIVALWGATGGSEAALRVNSDLVQTGTDLAKSLGATRLIHLSSAGVYGPGALSSEDSPIGQTGAYGQAKCAMEAAIAPLQGQDGITHIILRLGNVVGADSLAPALRGEKPARVDQFADGNGPLRSYIGASDFFKVLNAILDLPSMACPTLLNVASPAPIHMNALLTAAGRRFDWVKAPETAVPVATLDVSRMQACLPKLDLLDDADAMIRDWQHLDRQAAT